MPYEYNKLNKARLITILESKDKEIRQLRSKNLYLEGENVYLKNRSFISRVLDKQLT